MFDLDGTLIGQKNASFIVLKQFYTENKNKFGKLEQNEFFDKWFKAGRKNFQEFLKGEISFEEKMIIQTLLNENGSRKQTAEKLGISPRTLRYKLARMKKCGIAIPCSA